MLTQANALQYQYHLNSIFELMNPDNTMTINRILAHKIGLHETLIYFALISKHYYYSKHNRLDMDGSFFSTINDLFESTTLSRKQQDSAIKKLVGIGLISVKVKGTPPKRYFTINNNTNLISSLLNDETNKRDNEIQFVQNGQINLSEKDNSICPNGTNQFVQNGQINLSERDNKTKANNPNLNNLNLNQTISPSPQKNETESSEKPLKKNDGLMDGQIDNNIIINNQPKVFETILSEIRYENVLLQENETALVDTDLLKKCIIPSAYHNDKNTLMRVLKFIFQWDYVYNGFRKQEDKDLFELIFNQIYEFLAREKSFFKNPIKYTAFFEALNRKLCKQGDMYAWITLVMDEWRKVLEKQQPKNITAYMRSCIWNWLSTDELENNEKALANSYSANFTHSSISKNNNPTPTVTTIEEEIPDKETDPKGYADWQRRDLEKQMQMYSYN